MPALKKPKPLAAPIVALILCAATSCTKVGTGVTTIQRHAYTHPHELRFVAGADIDRLNPLANATGVEQFLTSLCMAWLIKTDAQGNVAIPELATEIPSRQNGGISRDGRTITWHLRRGVKWSDGAPFDADDVVFSTKQVLNPANNVVNLDGWDLITKIEEPDKYTVVYVLKKPYSSFADTFFSTGGANPAILPQHLLRGLADLNTAPYNSLPVGIGPFKFASWHRGDSVVMVRNSNYFRGPPSLNRVIFKTVPDANTALEQLRTHEIDLWLPVAPQLYPQTQAIAGIKGSAGPSFTFDHLDFNLEHAAVADAAVRQALRYALDRRELLQKVWRGLYLLNESPVSPASRYDAHLPLIAQSMDKANALLDASGWKRGPDGIRSKGGLMLRLTYVLSTGQPGEDTEAELIRTWWKQIGVGIVLKHYVPQQLYDTAANGGILFGGKFDVARFAFGTDLNEDLSNLYACNRFPPLGQNAMHWCDRSATAAMDRAKDTYDDRHRAKDLQVVQRALYAQVPTIILDVRQDLAAYNEDLKNWRPNSISPFDDMMKVDI